MRSSLLGLAQILLLLFPILSVNLIQAIGPTLLIAGVCVLLAVQMMLGRRNAIPQPFVVVAPAVGAALVAMTAIDSETAVLLYPVLTSVMMALVFGATLIWPPSMIERFARLADPGFSDRAIPYTRRVTVVWVAFLLVNGAVALWTALGASWFVWALYNGAISYVLIAALFLGELCLRPHLRPR